MNDTMKIIKSLKDSGLLINGVSETIKMKQKNQKGRFLGMLLGTLEAGQFIRKYVKRKRRINSYREND